MRIYYLSDLHLEYLSVLPRVLPPNDTSNDILILAGDIGNFTNTLLPKFLALASSKFAKVLYLPGNHEYWSDIYSIEETQSRLRNLCSGLGVVYLDRTIVTINNKIRVVGTTLWSYIPVEMESVMSHYLRDNRKIPGWSPQQARTHYISNYQWLQDILTTVASSTTIVVTHHAPLTDGTSHPKYHNDPRNCGYSSDCSELLDMVDYWIFGHTHYSTNIRKRRCQVISNQKGRTTEINTGYTIGAHIHC